MRQRWWQLGWRASIGYGIVVVAVAAAGWAAYQQLAIAREAGDQARHAQQVLLTVLLGQALFDRRTGLMAGLVAAVYPNLVAFSHYLWSENLYTTVLQLH